MILTLTASIMYWSLKRAGGNSEQGERLSEVSEGSTDDAEIAPSGA